MSSASPRGIILKNQFEEGKVINLRVEFYTYQESHMKSSPELPLVVKATVVLVSLLSKPLLSSDAPWMLIRVPCPPEKSFRMLFSEGLINI